MRRSSFLLSALSSIGRVISRSPRRLGRSDRRRSRADRSFIVPLFAASSGEPGRYFLGFGAHIRVMGITRVQLRNAVGPGGVRASYERTPAYNVTFELRVLNRYAVDQRHGSFLAAWELINLGDNWFLISSFFN